MHYLIPQIILAVTLLGCLKVEKKNQDVPSEVTQHVEVYSQPQFILDEHMTLTEDTIIDAERVYLTKNAAIFVQNYNLKIEAQIIEAEAGSVIAHYLLGQTAELGINGRNGGLIEINSLEARGTLYLTANSEKGGNGLTGWFRLKDGKPNDCNPGKGKNSGQLGTIKFQTLKSQKLYLIKKIVHSEGGSIGAFFADIVLINQPNYVKDNNMHPNDNCSESPSVGTPSYGGQVCTKLQNQANFSCVAN